MVDFILPVLAVRFVFICKIIVFCVLQAFWFFGSGIVRNVPRPVSKIGGYRATLVQLFLSFLCSRFTPEASAAYLFLSRICVYVLGSSSKSLVDNFEGGCSKKLSFEEWPTAPYCTREKRMRVSVRNFYGRTCVLCVCATSISPHIHFHHPPPTLLTPSILYSSSHRRLHVSQAFV